MGKLFTEDGPQNPVFLYNRSTEREMYQETLNQRKRMDLNGEKTLWNLRNIISFGGHRWTGMRRDVTRMISEWSIC